MRILLTTLNSKYIHTNLALKYLYCILINSNIDVKLEEYTINNDRDFVYNEIIRGGYDLVCFSCYIWNIEKIKELCSNLKKARPGMKFLLGGPEVSYEAENFIKENPWADFIIRGEGEKPFSQFMGEYLSERPDYTKVDAITFRKGKSVVSTERGSLPPMDSLPFPYTYLEVESDKIIYYESTRGCPFRCAYCISSLNGGVRAASLNRLRRDIAYLVYKGVKQVKFIDRTFNYDKKRANSFWQYLIDKDNGTTNFHFEICGDMLDEETFKILSKARKGLFQFEIGVQSVNPYTLKEINRKNTTDAVLTNVKRLVEIDNVDVHVDLIAGLPYEDYTSFGLSFDRVYNVKPGQFQMGFLKLLKGTKLRSIAEEHGYRYREKAPYEIISNKYISALDLVKLKMVETVLELFYNRGGFKSTLDFLMEELSMRPFDFYQRLADFYYRNEYHMVSHKKEDMYRIMYKFAKTFEYNHMGLMDRVENFMTLDVLETLNPEIAKRFMNKGWEF